MIVSVKTYSRAYNLAKKNNIVTIQQQSPHTNIIMMGRGGGESDRVSYYFYTHKNPSFRNFVNPKKFLLFFSIPKKLLTVFVLTFFIFCLLESLKLPKSTLNRYKTTVVDLMKNIITKKSRHLS